MLQLIRKLFQKRVEKLRESDYGPLNCFVEADSRNREAHDQLMHELYKLNNQLSRIDPVKYRQH